MKKISAFLLLIACFHGSYAQNMQPFGASNFLVLRVQNPSSSTGSLVLQEYNATGKRIQQLDLSTLTAPNNKCLSPSLGTGETEHAYMSLSQDGKYVTFPAFSAIGNGNARVGALVKFDGTINTETTFSGSAFTSTTVTADVSAATSVPLNTTSNAIVAGSIISGSGIPTGTTITAFNTTSKIATLSVPVTVANGTVVTIEITANSTFTPKSVVTKDGTGLWMSYSGFSTTPNGILYQPTGATGTPTLILASTPGNAFRQMNISNIDGNLYTSRTNSVYNFFNGTPINTQPAAANPPLRTVGNRINGNRGYCMVGADGGKAEVMYVAVVATANQSGATNNSAVNGSSILTLSAANVNFKDGNYISGAGILPGTKILSGGGTNSLVLSNPVAANLNGQAFYSSPDSVGGIYKFYRLGKDSVWIPAGKFGTSADNYLTVTAKPNGTNGFTLFATKNNFSGSPVSPTRASQQANLKAGSDTINLLTQDDNFMVGNEIAGTGLFTGTKILQVNGTQLIVSNKVNLQRDTTLALSTNTLLGVPNIVKIEDASAYNELINATEETVVTGLYQQAFRGIAVTPTDVPLPLKLISFTGNTKDNRVSLNWTSTDEKNVAFFEIEKGLNGKTFATIGNVNATNGNNKNFYKYNDTALLAQTSYYRLKMVDKDGAFTYSNVLSLVPEKKVESVKFYPNPTYDVLNVSFTPATEVGYAAVYTLSGKLLLQKVLSKNAKSTQLNVGGLVAGSYILKVKNGNTQFTQSFIKK